MTVRIRTTSSESGRLRLVYNQIALRFLWVVAAFPALLLCALPLRAQSPAAVGQTLLVVPFENQSKAPGLQWIGDSFPELLQERLNSPTLYVLSREERVHAYDRLGIPVDLRPSRATLYRIAEQLDVDYVLLGQYNFDGRMFTTHAQLLDMHHEHLLPEMIESGPLIELIDIQTALSWDLLHTLNPGVGLSREVYLAQAPPVRLDAFENYIKGTIDPRVENQVQHFREAVRLNPAYPEATLQLGKAYFRQRQYDAAMSWLSHVPEGDPRASEANFYLGLAAYYKGDFQRAESAFAVVAGRLPLSEVYNNLGVVVDHRDARSAVEYFRKAVEEDPNDSDYRFNLGVELYHAGDLAGASRQLREALSLKPGDNDASLLLDNLPGAGQRGVVPASSKLPSLRIRSNYDEGSFRQLALKIEAAAEQKLAKTDPRTHSQFHSDRGRQLLNQGFVPAAEHEFREAVTLNPANAEAHAGLAGVLEASNDLSGARSEAEEALRLRQFAEPLLVLARPDLRDNRVEAAAEEVDRALRLDANNTAAQALKRSVAAKLAQEAQPLPNR